MRHEGARDDLTRAEILALLGTGGPRPRAEIAQQLGLGGATVTAHAKRLLADGFVSEDPAEVIGAGRPRIPLRLMPDAAHVLGLRVAVDRVVGVIVRLDGSIVEEFTEPVSVAADPVGELAEIIRRRTRGNPRVRGVGVSVPGVVDSRSGTVRLSAILRWQDVPLGAELQRELELPLMVDNDLHATTTAELLFGLGREYDDFLMLGLGDGIGLGVVLNRQVRRGPDGTAGELGHAPIDPDDGPLCNCGARGCLQAYVGEHALVREARHRGLIGPRSGIRHVLRRAEEGDPGTVALLGELGRLLGRSIAGFVNVLAVHALQVIGESWRLWPYLESGFVTTARSGILAPLRDLEVRVEPWRDTAHARGAACLLLAGGMTW